jgi:sarcosine oxidase
MPAPDVIVVGLGSMGSAVAHELSARGHRVLGLERFSPVHDQGSGHGGSRIIRQCYFEGLDYVPLLRRAYEGWARLEEQSGTDIVTLCGGIYIGDPAEETFTGSLAAARRFGLPHEVLTAADIRQRFPAMHPADHALGVFEPHAGFVDPEATIGANITLARQSGADLRFGEQVLSWSITPGGGVEVVTGSATHAADVLVVAPGAWSRALLGGWGRPVQPERQVFYWLAPDYAAGPVAEHWSPTVQPVFIERTDGAEQVYGFPVVGGARAGLKIGIFHDHRPTDPDRVDRTVHADETQHMLDRARMLFPHLTGRVVDARTCLYPTAPDDHFMVGLHPEHRQVTVLTGFGGHGFKFVPVMGEIGADLATTGHTDLPIGLFALDRPTLDPSSDAGGH